MAERKPPNVDLAAYLLGKLGPGERARVEQELAANPASRADLAELEGTAELLKRAAPAYEVPAGLEARTFRALERAVAQEGEHAQARDEPPERAVPERADGRRRWGVPPARRRRASARAPEPAGSRGRPLLPRLALAGGLAVALVGAVFAGS